MKLNSLAEHQQDGLHFAPLPWPRVRFRGKSAGLLSVSVVGAVFLPSNGATERKSLLMCLSSPEGPQAAGNRWGSTPEKFEIFQISPSLILLHPRLRLHGPLDMFCMLALAGLNLSGVTRMGWVDLIPLF